MLSILLPLNVGRFSMAKSQCQMEADHGLGQMVGDAAGSSRLDCRVSEGLEVMLEVIPG
jgi:hypothetical protein